MASAVMQAYSGSLEQSPQQGPGAERLVRGSGGQSPWSWKLFSFWTSNGIGKICHIDCTWQTLYLWIV